MEAKLKIQPKKEESFNKKRGIISFNKESFNEELEENEMEENIITTRPKRKKLSSKNIKNSGNENPCVLKMIN